MLCAVATDDGVYLMNRHFGDAIRYDLYQLGKERIAFQETIINPFRDREEDEDFHGDKIKASNMKELFLEKGVSVLVSQRFGPNVRRMVKNFVPVLIRNTDVEEAKKLLLKNITSIKKMFDNNQNRKPLLLK